MTFLNEILGEPVLRDLVVTFYIWAPFAFMFSVANTVSGFLR